MPSTLPDILIEISDRLQTGQPFCYTALVETRGSTPQKAGAVMLVLPDGSQIGTLGGGCVEAEVKRRALEVMTAGHAPEIATFQLDHDYGWDDGLICGGRMSMLIDASPDQKYYEAFQAAIRSKRGCTEAISVESAQRCLFDHAGQQLATTAKDFEPAADLKPLANRPRPYLINNVAYLPQLERCELIIVGAGHVGQKLAQYAHDVDFDVTVVDDRAEYCNADLIPSAGRHLVGPFTDVLPQLEITPNSFCVIVTRGHNHDEEALFHLINRGSRYVGMIGSKRKIRLIYDDLKQQGISEESLQTVHAPIGLEIGSQTVAEIAVSIIAQLIAARNQPA